MITLTLPLSPSRHKRAAKADFLAALAVGDNARQVRRIMPQLYHVKFQMYGDWWCANGKPRRRDTDSPVVPLFDAIAKAAGIDDSWLNHGGFTVGIPVQSDRELIVVTLT